MTDYAFVTNGDDDDQEENENEQSDDDGWNWGLGDHSTVSEEERRFFLDSIRDSIDHLDETVDEDTVSVLEDARDLVQSTEVTRFECPHEDCGLGHSHPDWKHDIRASTDKSEIRSMIPGFKIEESFAEQMEFVPYCHCGANEAAMLVKFFPYIDTPMFKDQHQFEGVLEVDPDVLEAAYRHYDETGSISQAAGKAASEMGEVEAEVLPLGLREELELFFERRQQVERQANKAPIGQETRSVINDAFESLVERTDSSHEEAI